MPQQQTARVQYQVSHPFIFNSVTQRKQQALMNDVFVFTQTLKYNTTTLLPFESLVI